LTKGRLWGIYVSVDANGATTSLFLAGYYETLAQTLNGNDVLDGGFGNDFIDGGDDNATTPFTSWICAMSKPNQSQNHRVIRAYY
jgi:Ca2+-binding RTX toxin-like protein